MTDLASAERLAALDRRRTGAANGRRRRPAEASRVLLAGAGTAAVLTMVTAMAQADQAVEPVAVLVADSPLIDTAPAFVPATAAYPAVTEVPAPAPRPVRTITVARPARAQVSNGRTSASR